MFESEKNNPRCKNVSIIKLELVDANVKQRMEAAIKVVNEERATVTEFSIFVSCDDRDEEIGAGLNGSNTTSFDTSIEMGVLS